MAAPTFEGTQRGYRNLWEKAAIKPNRKADAEALARKIIKLRPRYEAVQKKTGVPCEWIGLIHMREAGNSFSGILHNGERIIGTGKKTKLVPKGRGPFQTWEEAAIDALTMPPHSLHKIKDWSIERMLYEAERYNGWGYMGKTNSPYVWSWTNLYTKGKYVADGKYSSTYVDQQPGVAAILKSMIELQKEAALGRSA